MEIVILPRSTERRESTRPSRWASQGPGARERERASALGPGEGSAFSSRYALQSGVWPKILDNEWCTQQGHGNQVLPL